jgi:lipoprotein-releasing system permease protein
MKLAFEIAWRFLTSAKRQTLIIILGISVGVSVQVFIGSLISGLQDSLVDTTIGSSSHITIVSSQTDERFIDTNLSLYDFGDLNKEFSVISPAFDTAGTLKKDIIEKEILFRGFDFSKANQIYKFNEKMISGRLPNTAFEIALGKDISNPNELDLSLNDTIDITILGQNYTLLVVGFFDFNVSIINRTWGIGTLETHQLIFNQPNKVTSIEHQIKKVFDAERIAESLDQLLVDQGMKTTNWMSENQQLLSGLNGQSVSSLMIQVFVIISVVLGISSTLAITVMQKSKQIGILKAMGILDRDASKIFLLEGAILGIFGAFGGIIFGIGLSLMFTTFALNPDGSPVIPLTINVGFILFSGLIAIFASTLASLIPAIKSSKLTVIEVIRNA